MNNPWLLALVPALLGIWGTYFMARKKKVLAWEVNGVSQLVVNGAKTKIPNRVQVFLNGLEVEDPYLITIRLVNVGNQPIRREDFDSSLRFEFQTNLHRFDLLDTSRSLQPHLEPNSGTSFVLNPVLLNSGDYLRVQVISSKRPNFECLGRIVGGVVREIATGPTVKALRPIGGLSVAVGTISVVNGLVVELATKYLRPISVATALGWSFVGVTPVVVILLYLRADRRTWPDKWR